MIRRLTLGIFLALIVGILSAWGQDLLRNLGQTQDYVSKRVSSFDRTGGWGFYVRFIDPEHKLRFAVERK